MAFTTSSNLVLLHGFLGFSHLGPIEYFRGIRKALLPMRIMPLIPEVPGAGTIAERAETLARHLFRSNKQAFALVGHSMGGLDARYLITHLDPDRRVKSLVTVATPHLGSPLAQWMLESRGAIPAWFRYCGLPGLRELTPEIRTAIPIPDRDDVAYASYASIRPDNELPFWLRHYARVIPEANDGLVPVSSARWGTFRGMVRADHIELLGWSLGLPDARAARPFNHLQFWKKVAAESLTATEEAINPKDSHGSG
ncbi:MAG TPA: alpha/beta fold hydrolase [Nitrosospira sp.]|nr:alpha/beta fold hydrolase [Nitrosospira sp.]